MNLLQLPDELVFCDRKTSFRQAELQGNPQRNLRKILLGLNEEKYLNLLDCFFNKGKFSKSLNLHTLNISELQINLS